MVSPMAIIPTLRRRVFRSAALRRSVPLKSWPLKFWLLLLVAAVVMPLSTLTGFVVWQARDAVRARAEDQLLHQAKANALVVEAEFQGIETGLRALAGSAALARGDMEAVEAEMRSLAGRMGGVPIGLAAADGQRVLCTLQPSGEGHGSAAIRPELASLIASRRAETGNLLFLPALGRPAAVVAVPVEAPGGGGRDLSFYAALPEGRLASLLASAGVEEGSVVTVLDRTGAVAARTRDEAAFLGRPFPVALPAGDDGRAKWVYVVGELLYGVCGAV